MYNPANYYEDEWVTMIFLLFSDPKTDKWNLIKLTHRYIIVWNSRYCFLSRKNLRFMCYKFVSSFTEKIMFFSHDASLGVRERQRQLLIPTMNPNKRKILLG